MKRLTVTPNHLTNLVVEDTASAPYYSIPTVSDDDPDNGPETLAKEFNDRNHFKIHILTANEADDLKRLGIVEIFNLNSYDNSTILAAGQAAAMKPSDTGGRCGCGHGGYGS